MKKIITLVVAIAAILLLALTCPNKQAHQDKIKVIMSSIVEEGLNKEASDDEKGFALLGSLFATKMVEVALDQKLDVSNYVVCSVGKVSFEGKTHYISFGILNQVFVLGQDKMRQTIKEIESK